MGRYHDKASFSTFSHYKSMVNKGTTMDFEGRYRPYNENKMRILHKLL